MDILTRCTVQDHMRGRRHARRLQYIRNMPESERTPFMERVASGESTLICHPAGLEHQILYCSTALLCILRQAAGDHSWGNRLSDIFLARAPSTAP